VDGLAAAGSSDHGDELAVADGEVDAVDGVDRALALAEGFLQVG